MKITVYNKNSNGLERAIQFAISTQNELLKKRPDKKSNGSGLISQHTPLELRQLMVQYDAHIHILQIKNISVAFALTTNVKIFTDLYKKKSDGAFVKNARVGLRNFRYLYQIAVRPKFQRKSYGCCLIDHLKHHHARGLITDVLVEPLFNQNSLDFFKKNDFSFLGELTLKKYRDFGRLKSHVYTWKN